MLRFAPLLIVWLLASTRRCFASSSATTSQSTRRFSVRYHSGVEEAELLGNLNAAGYTVVEHFDRQQVLAVVHPAHDEDDAVHSERLAGIAGVQVAERDHELHPIIHGHSIRRSAAATVDACGVVNDPEASCKWKNTPLNKTGNGTKEIVPFAISMTQAMDPTLNSYRSTANSGVLICSISSGVDKNNLDFTNSNLKGCTSDNDLETGFQCPFEDWGFDTFGLGTFQTGIMAAEEDGYGVVGMIPNGADIFNVKIFNGTCAPSFGCGPTYGTNLVQAYLACEDHLNAKQSEDVSKRWVMVVAVTAGGPGPATLEQMYFNAVGQRDDIIWVAPTGDTQVDPSKGPQVGLSYPAGYKEVISVAAVDCSEKRLPFSVINSDVELSAPGGNIPGDSRSGLVAAFLKELDVSPAPNISLATVAALGGVSIDPDVTVITVAGRLVDCGLATAPCDGVRGAVCLIGRGVNNFDVKLANCEAGGGVGAMIYNYATSKGCDLPSWAQAVTVVGQAPTPDVAFLPSVKMTYNQGVAIQALLSRNVTVNVSISLESVKVPIVYSYGTALATPHVTAAAARVWSAYPRCTAAEVRAALRAGAKPLGTFAKGTNRNSEYGFGLVQVKDALTALSKAKCAQNTQKKTKSKGRKLR